MADEPTATDWAYLAGLIDGEGSLALVHRKGGSRVRNGHYTSYRSDNSYQCHITITNTDSKMIDWVRDTFGGCTYFQRARGGNRKPIYVAAWQANDEVVRIIENTLPYMLTKYEVAQLIMQFLSTPKWERDVRELLHKEFKEIKEKIRVTGGTTNE